MRVIQLFTLIVLLLTALHGLAEELPDIVDSETIVEDLLRGDGKTRGISVQPRILHSPDKPKLNENQAEEPPTMSATKPPRVKSDETINKKKVHQPSTVALNIQFQFDSAQLTEHAVKQLNEIGKALTSNQLSNYTFEIAGHTDSVGKSSYNKWLSEQRAKTVKKYLINYFGLQQNTLLALGYGEEQPYLQDDPTNGVNRRVEIRAYVN